MNGLVNGLYDGLNDGLNNGLFDGNLNGLHNGLNSSDIGLDIDAYAFIIQAGISSQLQRNAVNFLVKRLKSYNIWSKMLALYPFIGGTSTTHKYNLKDTRDLDAAFRLSFIGGWTHTDMGAKPNGTNGYANTFFNPNINLTVSSAHFAKYQRTNDITGTKLDGCTNNNFSSIFQHNYTTANSILGGNLQITYTPTKTTGFIIGTRTANNLFKAFRNNSQLGSTQTGTITSMPSFNIYIGNRNDFGNTPAYWNSYQCAFASIGLGLTDSESSILYNIVNQYQTILGRQVI